MTFACLILQVRALPAVFPPFFPVMLVVMGDIFDSFVHAQLMLVRVVFFSAQLATSNVNKLTFPSQVFQCIFILSAITMLIKPPECRTLRGITHSSLQLLFSFMQSAAYWFFTAYTCSAF